VAEHDEEDAALLLELLNGRKARYRRENRPRGPEPKTYTVVTDPDQLDPYERLFYDEDPNRPKETVAVCAFYWAEVFTYEEAAAWYAVGATYDDFHTCKGLAQAGVTPELASRPFTRNGYSTGMNVLRGVATGMADLDKVSAWARRVELARRKTA
jgi:hypothetical protein